MEGREVGNAMDEPQEQEADSLAKRPRVDVATAASPNQVLMLSPSPPRPPAPTMPPPASPTDAIQDIANDDNNNNNGGRVKKNSVSDVDSGAGSIINGPNSSTRQVLLVLAM